MKTVHRPRRALLSDERGLSTVEYAVLFVAIAIATISLFTNLGTTLAGIIN